MKGMKVLLALSVLSIVIATALFCISIFGKSNSYDINNDGEVNSLDMLLLQKYLLANGDNRCDVNGDGRVSAQDYVIVKNYIMNH